MTSGKVKFGIYHCAKGRCEPGGFLAIGRLIIVRPLPQTTRVAGKGKRDMIMMATVTTNLILQGEDSMVKRPSQKKRLVIHFMFILTCILAAACGGTVQPQPISSPTVPSPSSNQPTPNVRVIPDPVAEPRSLSPRRIERNNCGSSTQIEYRPGREETITRIMELGVGTEISAKGTAKFPLVGEVNVGAKISGTYNTSYGSEATLRDELTFTIPPRTLVEYDIQVIEFWQKGIIIISDGTNTITDTYAFRDSFALNVTPVEKPCPTVTPANAPTAVPVVSTPTEVEPTVESPKPATVPATPIPPVKTLPPPSNNISNFRVQQESDSRVKITVDYTYNGDHGSNVNLGIYVLHNGEKLPWFGWDVMIISAGSGTVSTRINYDYNNPPSTTTTDQIVVTFYANDDPAFYSQTFDYPMTWRTAR